MIKRSEGHIHVTSEVVKYGGAVMMTTVTFYEYQYSAINIRKKALHLRLICIRSVCGFFPQDVGYQHGKTVFDVWCRSGVVEKMLKDRHQEEFHKSKNTNVCISTYSTAICL